MAPTCSKCGDQSKFVLLINNVRNFLVVFIHYFNWERKVSRVLATSSERFHQKIQIQQLSAVYLGLSDKT